MSFEDSQKQSVNKPNYTCVYLSVASALLGPLLFGMCQGFSGPAIDTMKDDVTNSNGIHIPVGPKSDLAVFNDTEASLFSSMVTIGAMIGALSGGTITEYFGRRKAILFCGPIFILCNIWIGFANTSVQLIIARVPLGMAVGLVSFVVPTYIGEVSPKELRGAMGAGNQLAITIGILLTYLLGLALRTDADSLSPLADSSTFSSWRVLSFVLVVPSALLLICNWFIPESPRWHASRGEIDEALHCLRKLRGGVLNDEEVVLLTDQANEAKNRIALRRSPTKEAGLSDKDLMSATVMIVQVLVTVVAVMLMDKAGRRVLLIGGAIGMCISAVLEGLFFQLNSSGTNVEWLAIVASYGYIASFSIGVGAIPWLIMAEIFPNKVRGHAASIATAVNWTGGFIVTMFLDSVQKATSYQAVFWFFAIVCAGLATFVHFIIPETKGKTFEEIEAHFDRERIAREESREH